MEKVAVRINNSVHVDKGYWHKDRMIYGYILKSPTLGKNLNVLDENGLPIFGTTKIQSMRFGKMKNGLTHKKSIIVETMNSEYEIFSEDFEKSGIVEN